jgi:hypothetical protein
MYRVFVEALRPAAAAVVQDSSALFREDHFREDQINPHRPVLKTHSTIASGGCR